ncbi:hypothetical protein JNB88_32850 [Rhizobium cauense]|uniref:RT0821/Lpp0805 family surface protein n=1 Tax=Rhizobium cauense TaxID=1166683 RepID=UPI001C6E85DA|nr:RT0821/Lpp0805 family surface protein [Rhizobium cauense]MBW9118392.1 hypothetical protein [Rhizobium cauense]
MFERWKISLTLPAIVVWAASCSTTDPLNTSEITSATPPQFASRDNSIIADAVGRAGIGDAPVAWANPSTGSAGVIRGVTIAEVGPNCRNFTTTLRTLSGETRTRGVACLQPDGSWDADLLLPR